jgi:uncharacterized protein
MKLRFEHILIFCFVICLVVIAISFGVVRKLVYANKERIYHGEKISLTSQNIHTQLLKEYNLEHVSFKTNDGVNLSGIIIKRDNPDKLVILCHGFLETKEFLHSHINLFPQSTILLFDFRAHGQSGGKLTTIGLQEYEDVTAASKFLKQRYGKSIPLVILGVSMGGAASLKATALDDSVCDAIIIDSAYSDLSKIIARQFTRQSGLPRNPFLYVIKKMFILFWGCDLDSMRPFEYVKRINKPLLFIHAKDDDHTPDENSVFLYSQAKRNGKSELWIGPNAIHGKLCDEHFALYKEKVDAFLKKFNL